jgi:hypothetical protein
MFIIKYFIFRVNPHIWLYKTLFYFTSKINNNLGIDNYYKKVCFTFENKIDETSFFVKSKITIVIFNNTVLKTKLYIK